MNLAEHIKLPRASARIVHMRAVVGPAEVVAVTESVAVEGGEPMGDGHDCRVIRSGVWSGWRSGPHKMHGT